MQNQRLKNVAGPLSKGLVSIAESIRNIQKVISPEADKCIENDDLKTLKVYADVVVVASSILDEIVKMQKTLYTEVKIDSELNNSIIWEE